MKPAEKGSLFNNPEARGLNLSSELIPRDHFNARFASF
jgi:hypothetical protein